MVRRIQGRGEEGARAERELCAHASWVGSYLRSRKIGSSADMEEAIQDVLLATILAIRKGSVRHPDAVPAMMKTIANRRASKIIQRVVEDRRNEQLCEHNELPRGGNSAFRSGDVNELEEFFTLDIGAQALQGLRNRERDILERALNKQRNAQICAEMNLTPNQCRNLKSRAKKRFIEYGKELLRIGVKGTTLSREDLLKQRRTFKKRFKAEPDFKETVLAKAKPLIEDPHFRDRLHADPDFILWLTENISRLQSGRVFFLSEQHARI